MYDNREGWPLSVMARTLHVSVSGYYAWLKKPNSPRHDQDAQLQVVIQRLFNQSNQTYGSPRIYQDMRALGHRISEKRVARLMREMGLTPVLSRKSTRTTTVDKDAFFSSNLLNRDFSAENPNEKWVGDITYIDTEEGWLYLAVVLDLFSRRIVGWAMDEHIDARLVNQAIEMAVKERQPDKGLIFHSDRGCQYTSQSFRSTLKNHGIQQSMSATGDCYDNAVAESFFHTPKIDCVYRHIYLTRAEARMSIFRYVHGFYNNHRRHSTINYMSPRDWELQHAS